MSEAQEVRQMVRHSRRSLNQEETPLPKNALPYTLKTGSPLKDFNSKKMKFFFFTSFSFVSSPFVRHIC